MIEKLIVLEDIDPVIFYGVNNANMQLIKALYPKLRIVARGNVIKVLGDEEEMCAFEENITKLEKYCAEYNSLKEEVIIDIIKGNAPQAEKSGSHRFPPLQVFREKLPQFLHFPKNRTDRATGW